MSTRRKKKGVQAEGVDRISMGRRRRAGRMLWLLTKIPTLRSHQIGPFLEKKKTHSLTLQMSKF